MSKIYREPLSVEWNVGPESPDGNENCHEVQIWVDKKVSAEYPPFPPNKTLTDLGSLDKVGTEYPPPPMKISQIWAAWQKLVQNILSRKWKLSSYVETKCVPPVPSSFTGIAVY